MYAWSHTERIIVSIKANILCVLMQTSVPMNVALNFLILIYDHSCFLVNF